MKTQITNKEKQYLRELAEKYARYAGLNVMKERTSLWYAHNKLKSDRPVVVMENSTFNGDFLPSPKCESETGRFLERTLLDQILNFELINDDKVIPPYIPLDMKIDFTPFARGFKHKYREDSEGRAIGYRSEHLIEDLTRDLPKLSHSLYSVDRKHTENLKNCLEDAVGDILPVKIRNTSLNWQMMPSAIIIELMGMESMMLAMFDTPDEMKELVSFVKEDLLMYIRWQEREGLLTLNNGNDYAGSGSYGFTEELPFPPKDDETVRTGDLWGNMNSQESVGISPDMYGEFFFPAYKDLAGEFGLLYYGCCEPVHEIWEDYLSQIPNLRKVSVSPWCNQKKMGEYLKGSGVIYSRKPSPNYIGVGRELDEESFRRHIAETLDAAEGNTLEIIFRDIYNLEGNRGKPGRAVEIVRELINSKWR